MPISPLRSLWVLLSIAFTLFVIPTFAMHVVCAFKLLKIIYRKSTSEELWDLSVKDALKVQLLEPIYKGAVAINILQDITKYPQLMVMYRLIWKYFW